MVIQYNYIFIQRNQSISVSIPNLYHQEIPGGLRCLLRGPGSILDWAGWCLRAGTGLQIIVDRNDFLLLVLLWLRHRLHKNKKSCVLTLIWRLSFQFLGKCCFCETIKFYMISYQNAKIFLIKGTQAWDIFEFFFDLNQILICPW